MTRRRAFLVALIVCMVPSLAFPSAAWARAGRLDHSFGGGDGVVTTRFADPAHARDVVVPGHGRIVVGGMVGGDMAVARYLPSGRLDRTLGGDGRARIDFGSKDALGGVVTTRTGRIVLAGSTGRAERADIAVARLRPSGDPDPSFGEDGRVIVDLSGFDFAFEVGLQPDGRIVVVGQSASEIAVVRLLTNGSLDPSFGTDGVVTERLGFTGARARSVFVRGDDRIVVGGDGVDAGCSGGGCTPYQFVARFNPDGSLDATFGEGGVVRRPSAGPDSSCYGCDVSMAVEPSGRILLVSEDFIAAYTEDGRFDRGFGHDGVVTPHIETGTNAVAVQRDGRIVVAGARITQRRTCIGCTLGLGLERLRANGSVDRSFGYRGQAWLQQGASADGLGIDARGRIVAVGTFGHRFGVARFLGA